MRGDPTGVLAALILILAVAALALYSMLRTARHLIHDQQGQIAALSGTNIELKKVAADSAELHAKLKKDVEGLSRLLKETATFYPSLAQALADYQYLQAHNVAYELRTKKHPAISSAEQVKEIARERRALERELHELKYQLLTYEGMFPWLIDVSGRSTTDILDEWDRRRKGLSNTSKADGTDDVEPERKWLSPDEFSALTIAQRADLALDRWRTSRRASNWEAGRDYERFVGFGLEQDGFNVEYWGALKGFEDLGRDLIATRDSVTKVVQCKRWSVERIIHEKHVFQLIGTALEYACLHRDVPIRGIDLHQHGVIPVLVTTAQCSETARRVSKLLGVELVESNPLGPYPVVKCNVSGQTGEKIYHLPFDQQYDRIKIDPTRGEFYAGSAVEAEKSGFRRAHRHLAGL